MQLPPDIFSEVTLASVKKRLSEEEHDKAMRGTLEYHSSGVSASDFIVSGMELEEQQYVYKSHP